MRVLITGAGGFIGGFLVAESLRRGHETWAAVRATTNRKFLTDPRTQFIELDFTDEQALRQTIGEHVASHGRWDFVVHNLGVTKANNYLDFERVNYGYLRLLAETLTELDAKPDVLLLMSSLSVMGPGDEQTYTPFTAGDVPMPNTRYGASKLKAEAYLRSQAEIPWTIFRCTGVYGPHERDYYLMIKSVNRGFDFSVGLKKQMLTFVYVADLARAVFMALDKGPLRKSYFISEPRGYTQDEFRRMTAKALGKRFVIPIRCPIWLLRAVCRVAEWLGKLTMKPATLNRDKFNILKQRNWLCDTAPARDDFGFSAETDLEKGLDETIAWYRQAKWL